MRICHISTSDIKGGAAIAAHRLHRALLERDVDSSMFVLDRAVREAEVLQHHGPHPRALERIPHLIRKVRVIHETRAIDASRRPGGNYFTSDRSIAGPRAVAGLPEADIHHLHWVAGFLSWEDFFPAIARRGTPIAWTLHDMNPFTGGCHYDAGCGRFVTGCGDCPELRTPRPRDFSRRIFQRKLRALSSLADDQLHVICLSRWMRREVERSSLLGRFTTHLVPNSLDTDVFVPADKLACRAALDLPTDARIVLFVAEVANAVRKGFALLDQAVRQLEADPDAGRILVVSIGRFTPTLTAGLRHIHLGSISEEGRLAMAYAAADVFAIPSLQDNLPNTVLESLACGVPVAGFAVGGIPDMVRPGQTGGLAPDRDHEALGREILALLKLEGAERARVAAACRATVLERHHPEVVTRAMIGVYEDMLAARGGSPATSDS